MKTIYRIESKRTGLGWYTHDHYYLTDWLGRGGESTWQMLTSLLDADTTPSPHHDDECLGGIDPAEYCGFSTFEQMANWFPQAVLREILFGAMSEWFEIVEYHVEEDFVREGWYQCLFELSQESSRIPLAYLPT